MAVFFFYKDAAPTELKKMRIDILTTQPQPRMFIDLNTTNNRISAIYGMAVNDKEKEKEKWHFLR